MRVLLITNLFPSPVDPNRGIFIKQLVCELRELCDVVVVCPLPWFPKMRSMKILSRWQSFANIPENYEVDGIKVISPKYIMLPKFSDPIHSILMYLGIARCIRNIHREHAIDVINAQWLYPDGVASSWLARWLQVPIVLTALGCDVNLFLGQSTKRLQILSALQRANAITVVSKGLGERLAVEAIPNARITVIPNGVNLELFYPRDRNICSSKLGIPLGLKNIVFVGRLEEEKGVAHLIDACRLLLAHRSDFHLYLIGEGPLRKTLEACVVSEGVSKYVSFLGRKNHEDVALWIGASNVLCLPSVREGCPNVVVESLASGRPVVGSAVGGVPDLINSESGILVPPANPRELATALHVALGREWDSHKVAASVSGLTWKKVAIEYFSVLRSVSRHR